MTVFLFYVWALFPLWKRQTCSRRKTVPYMVDPSVQPRQATTRPVPLAKLNKVNEELRRLCDVGALTLMSQPTDWFSKIRICIDPSKNLNKAIERPVYIIPTIEEKLPLLTNAKVFEIVNAYETFHTVELKDLHSWQHFKVWTVGICMYTRIPFGISSGPEEYQRRRYEFLEVSKVWLTLQTIYAYLAGETPKKKPRQIPLKTWLPYKTNAIDWVCSLRSLRRRSRQNPIICVHGTQTQR